METLIIYRFVIVLAAVLIGFILAVTGKEMLSDMDWQDNSLDMDECADCR